MPGSKKVSVLLLAILCCYFATINLLSVKASFSDIDSIGPIKVNLEFAAEDSILDTNNNYTSPKRSLYVVGDIMLARDVERRMLSLGNDYPYRKIIFDKNESYILGNFEGSVPIQHQPTADNTFRFSVNSKFLPALKDAGFTHMSLANNHAFDFGLAGYNHTISSLWDNGLIPFGHPSILSSSSVTFIDINEIKVSVIAIHTLLGNPEAETIREILNYATSNSNYQIVYIHWGSEYSEYYSSSQESLAKLLSKHGADIIIGHHPHVVQGVGKIDETLVFYSLGNYIFDQYFSNSVQNGLMLKLSFAEELTIDLVPVTSIDNRNQPRQQTVEETQSFLDKLATISNKTLEDEIKLGKITLHNSLASSSEVAIMAE